MRVSSAEGPRPTRKEGSIQPGQIKEETEMPKFYVTCGCQHLVIQAESAEMGAMRLLDELLGEHVWIYDDAGLSEGERRDHLVLEALLHLGSQIRVSERGLGRCEAGVFDVPQLLDRWDRLMTAVSRLFLAAGLAPRRIFSSETAAGESASGRKHPR